MIDIEWILERKQHSIFRRLTDVVDDPRVIVETLRILWGGGAIRAVLIFCDQPWFYNLTLPRQHGAEITFASLVSLPFVSPLLFPSVLCRFDPSPANFSRNSRRFHRISFARNKFVI